MRRLRIHVLMLLGILSFNSCSREDYSSGRVGSKDLCEIEFTFQANTDGNGGSSSGENQEMEGMTFEPDGKLLPKQVPPRQVLSSNNWQQVNDVRVYVFKKDAGENFVYYKPMDGNGEKKDYLAVNDFTRKFDLNPYLVWWGGVNDVNESYRYSVLVGLEQGEYRFLALARDDREVVGECLLSDPNVVNPELGWEGWKEGNTTLDEATITCSEGVVMASTELFSGCTQDVVSVDESSRKFSCSIELKRAVAGILLYIENIPSSFMAYNPEEELGTGIIPMPIPFTVVSIAVVHGKILSDQVRVASREAVDGCWEVSEQESGGPFNPPTPIRTLLKIAIPESAEIEDGFFVNTSPDNVSHPNSLLGGVFVMPQGANEKTEGEQYDKSLYLVFYGRTPESKKEFALAWFPIRLSASGGEDPLYYAIRANHFYSIGRRNFKDDGSELPPEDDVPLNLQKGMDIVIQLDPFWNEYYGGEIGDEKPGLALDPEWGEHPGGEIQNKEN